MAKTFRMALKDALDREGRSVAWAAERAGISGEQLKKLLQRPTARTNYEDAIRVARVFGLTLDEFLEDDLASDRLEIARIYMSLSPEERRILRAAGRGMLALAHDPDVK